MVVVGQVAIIYTIVNYFPTRESETLWNYARSVPVLATALAIASMISMFMILVWRVEWLDGRDVQFFRCIDCNVHTRMIDEYYMVTDETWAIAGMMCDGGMLCIGCLEKRIG